MSKTTYVSDIIAQLMSESPHNPVTGIPYIKNYPCF